MKESLKYIFVILLLFFFTLCNFAQEQVRKDILVTGFVKDKNNEPIIGVTVKLKKSNKGTITDLNGRYSLLIPRENSRLTFSYVGFQSTEIEVKGNNLDVVLLETSKVLDDVVVIGYGVSKKRDLTGAISSISSKSIEERTPINVFEALQGQVAGVEIISGSGAPGEGADIKIRGVSTFESGAKPLYVIDGVTSDGIDDLNPNDIESIEVLKDAASAAIYGSRSANGVILITTKQGDKANPKLNIRYLQSYSSLTRKMPKANAVERKFYDSVRSKYRTGTYEYSTGDSLSIFHNQDIDTQDLLFRTAKRNQVDLSASGAGNSFKYYLSVSYLNEEGIIINSDYNRISSRANMEYKPTNNLTIGSKIQFSLSNTNGISEAGVLTQLLQRIPYWAIFNSDGSYVPNLASKTNPYAVAMDDINKSQSYKFTILDYLEYKFNKNLKFISNFQGNFDLKRNQDYRPEAQLSLFDVTTGIDQTNLNYNWANENYFTYNTKINTNHNIESMIGWSFQNYHVENINLTGLNYTTDMIYTLNAASAYDVKNTNTIISEHSMASCFGRIGYNYKSKYLFNANLRYDGSSRFGKSNRWGAFPSVSGGWRFSDENFLKWMKPFVYDAKVRLSYGITGNEAIGDYDAYLLYSPDFIYNNISGIGASNLSYDNLSWERTTQYNVGLDLRLLNNKVNIVADYYLKNTDQLLSMVQLPKETGFSTIRKNVGAMSNEGFEFSIEYNIVNNKKLKWSANFNIATNVSKIVKIADGIPFYKGTGDAIYIQENARIGEFYGYKQLGIFAYDESNAFTDNWERLTPTFEDGVLKQYTLNGSVYSGNILKKKNAAGVNLKGGDVEFEDVNQDGITTNADKQLIGCAQSDFFGGLSTNFSYKEFSLLVGLYYSFGGDIYKYEESRRNAFTSDATTPSPEAILNMWTKQGDIATYPIPIPSDHNSLTPSDFYIEDGSYIKLKNVRLSYEISKKIAQKVLLKSITVYIYGNNLLTFTNYKGYDPEFSSGSDPLTSGIDTNRYPRKKEFGFGININL